MNNLILLGLGIMLISFSLVLALSPAETAIPPTPAFRFINNSDSSISINASNYTDTLFITAGENMSIQYFPNNKTIRLSAVIP